MLTEQLIFLNFSYTIKSVKDMEKLIQTSTYTHSIATGHYNNILGKVSHCPSIRTLLQMFSDSDCQTGRIHDNLQSGFFTTKHHTQSNAIVVRNKVNMVSSSFSSLPKNLILPGGYKVCKRTTLFNGVPS